MTGHVEWLTALPPRVKVAVSLLKSDASELVLQTIQAASVHSEEDLNTIKTKFIKDYIPTLTSAGANEIDAASLVNDILLDYQYAVLSHPSVKNLSRSDALYLWQNLPSKEIVALKYNEKHDFTKIHDAILQNPEFNTWCFIAGIDEVIDTDLVSDFLINDSFIWLSRFCGNAPQAAVASSPVQASLSRLYRHFIYRRNEPSIMDTRRTMLPVTLKQMAEINSLLDELVISHSRVVNIRSCSSVEELKYYLFRVGVKRKLPEQYCKDCANILVVYLIHVEIKAIALVAKSLALNKLQMYKSRKTSRTKLLRLISDVFDLLRYPLVTLVAYGLRLDSVMYELADTFGKNGIIGNRSAVYSRGSVELGSFVESARKAISPNISFFDLGLYGSSDLIHSVLYGHCLAITIPDVISLVSGFITRFGPEGYNVYHPGQIEFNETIDLMFHLSSLMEELDISIYASELEVLINKHCMPHAELILQSTLHRVE